MTVDFTKAEGSQNDFVIIDDRKRAIDTKTRRALSIAMCHRRTGVGADGAIFLDRSERYDFTMNFFNPDGSVGSMCGNGGRCAALYAYTHGIGGTEMRFDVLENAYRAEVHGSVVRVYFPDPSELRLDGTIDIDGSPVQCRFANTGAPHAVIFGEELGISTRKDLLALDVQTLGYEVRHTDVYGPGGVNANFVLVGSDGTISIRTFEKGVEAETEACGTGTIASALLAHITKGIAPPLRLKTRNGDVLEVGFTAPEPSKVQLPSENGMPVFEGLYFEGRTNLVFNGTFAFYGGL